MGLGPEFLICTSVQFSVTRSKNIFVTRHYQLSLLFFGKLMKFGYLLKDRRDYFFDVCSEHFCYKTLSIISIVFWQINEIWIFA